MPPSQPPPSDDDDDTNADAAAAASRRSPRKTQAHGQQAAEAHTTSQNGKMAAEATATEESAPVSATGLLAASPVSPLSAAAAPAAAAASTASLPVSPSAALQCGLPSAHSFVVPDSPAQRAYTPSALSPSPSRRPPRHPPLVSSASAAAALGSADGSGGSLSTAGVSPSGEEGDCEETPPTAYSAARGSSMRQLPSAVATAARPKAHSVHVLARDKDLPLFHADRLDSTAAPASAQALQPWKRTGSSFNLLLSSHLSSMFGGADADAASSAPDGGKGNFFSRLRQLLSPLSHWSSRGTTYYLLSSLCMAYLVRAAATPQRRVRNMLTYGLPFLVREAPHIFLAAVLLAMLRSLHQQWRSFPNWSLLAGWAANFSSVAGLTALLGSIVRDGAAPFRRQMAAAAIRMPHQLTSDEESVLTIAPAGHDQAGTVQPLEAERTPAEAAPHVIGSGILDVSDPCGSVSASRVAATEGLDAAAVAAPPSDSTLSAYRRLGRMSPLRWFLTATQLTRTLAWSEEVRWKTGIVYEKLHTRHKTKALKLDMYRPKQEPGAPKPRLPVFLYIHGGGWVTGHRSFHSLTLLYAVCKSGFLVVSANYRLSPWVKHPTHLMDCKRALAWIRTHADEIGADPSFITVGGESAGAHLACLLALTPNNPYLQPGFESVDTSVAGVVDLYGSHDFSDSHLHFRSREEPGSIGFDAWLHRAVMGVRMADSHAEYQMASPLFRLQHFALPAAMLPPFFGAHGTADDLIPVGDSDEFYRAVRDKRKEAQSDYEGQVKAHAERLAEAEAASSAGFASVTPLPPLPPFPQHDVYVRVPGASHVFNNVMSKRSFALNDSVTAWLLSLRQHHRERAAVVEQRQLQSRALAHSTSSATIGVIPDRPQSERIMLVPKL